MAEDETKIPFKDKLKYDFDLKYINSNFKEDVANAVDKIRHDLPSKIEELRNVVSFPPTYELATFASKAYENRIEGESDADFEKREGTKAKKIPDGWETLTAAVNKATWNGYVGIAFWKPEQRQIVIAHRGTVPTSIGADYTDMKGIFGNNFVSQMNSACTFAHEVYAAIQEVDLEVDDIAKWQIFFTGHSLGAWLAQITTFSLKYLEKAETIFVGRETIGYHAHTEVFDSPGCQEMLSLMANYFSVRYYLKVIDISNLDITSYLSYPNLVNCCNLHVGTLFRIYPKIDYNKTGKYSLESHKMDAILSFFAETSFPKMKRVIDWPKIEVSFSLSHLAYYFATFPWKSAEPFVGEEFDNFFKCADKLKDFNDEAESVSLNENIAKKEKLNSKLFTQNRYQVAAVETEVKFCKTVFTELELETLQVFNWLRKVKEFFEPETYFVDLTKKGQDYVVKRLGQLRLDDDFVTCNEGFNPRELIPFAKYLVKLYPGLNIEMKDALSPLEARKKIYINITAEYLNKLKNTVSMFRSSKNRSLLSFVQDDEVKMGHIETDYGTDLVMARALKCLESSWDSFKNHFAMEIQSLITVDKSFKFGEILTSDLLGKTLVLLECKDSVLDSSQIDTLNNLIDDLTTIDSVKILLVSLKQKNKSKINTDKLGENYEKISCHGFKWDDLNEPSKLLSNKVVRFQGQKEKVSFVDVIGNNSSEIGALFDSLTLTKLIKNETIAIGSKLEGLNETRHYYIPRTFEYNKRISHNIFKNFIGNNILVLSGINEKDCIAEFQSYLGNDFPREKCKFIKESYEDFSNLCLENPMSKFHWIHYKDHSLYWKASRGNTKFIRQAMEEKDTQTFTENKDSSLLNKLPEGIIVTMSEGPGMGKSTVLTTLATKHKELSPCQWVVRVNLNDCTEVLKKLLAKEQSNYFTKENRSEAVKFLLEEMFKNDGTELNELEKKLLEYNLMRHGGVVIFVDAFDEISPDYDDIVTQLLDSLSYCRVRNLFVATRPRPELENNLGTLAIQMKPLQEEDQVDLLKRFWENSTTPNGESFVIEGDKEEIATYCIKKLTVSIKDQENIMGIPLQCKLLAEYIMVNCKSMEDITHVRVSLANLYESFIKSKFSIYHTDKGLDDKGNPSAIIKNNFFELHLRRFHQLLALRLIMGKEEKLLTDEDIKILQSELLRVGIVDENQKFVHRSYAEYFVVDYLLTCDDSNKSVALTNEILVKEEYNVLRTFLDSEIKSDKRPRESRVIFQNYVDDVVRNWKGNLNNYRNDYRETALMVTLKEKNIFIVELLIEFLGKKKGDSDMISYIHSEDQRKSTPLHYACLNGNEKCVEFLVENPPLGIDILNEIDDDGDWPLSLACINGHTKIVHYLIDNNANVNASNKHGLTPLHSAVYSRKEEIVDILIEKEAIIDAMDESGRTPLYQAFKKVIKNIALFLIEKGANVKLVPENKPTLLQDSAKKGWEDVVPILVEKGIDIEATAGEFNRTPLHFAAEKGRKDVVKWLIKKGAIIDSRDDRRNTPLHLATKNGHVEIVNFLINEVAEINDHGDSPLSLDCKNDHAKTDDYLIDNKADVNAANKRGQTPLHIAALNSRVEIADSLIKHKANINALDEDGWTPLYTAFAYDKKAIALFLIKKGANVKLLPKDGRTLLHLAAKNGWDDVVRMFIENLPENPDIEAIDENNQTPLHLAAINGRNEVVKCLIANHAAIDAKNNANRTPLQLATAFGRDEIVRFLIKKGADLKAVDNYGNTLLHLAAAERYDYPNTEGTTEPGVLCSRSYSLHYYGVYQPSPISLNLLKYLLPLLRDHGIDINAQNNRGETPLHFAVASDRSDIVKLLVENHADINKVAHEQNVTPLDIANMYKHVEIAQFLLDNGANREQS